MTPQTAAIHNQADLLIVISLLRLARPRRSRSTDQSRNHLFGLRSHTRPRAGACTEQKKSVRSVRTMPYKDDFSINSAN
jgi:hypothetical protein